MSIETNKNEVPLPFAKHSVLVVFVAVFLGGAIIICCVLASIKLFQRYRVVRSSKNVKNKGDAYNTSDSESDIEGPQFGRR